MQRRHPLPRLWLMTDERQGEALWTALNRLPRGAGIVFRHYSLPSSDRKTLFLRIRRLARRKHLMLICGRGELERADGCHGPGSTRARAGIRTASAHNLAEIRAAERSGAHLIFLSPVYPTRSHPGARALGRIRFSLLAQQTNLQVIALGGMNRKRVQGLGGAYGWAAIDASSD